MSVCSGVLFVGRGAIDNFVFVVAFFEIFLFVVPSLVSFSLLLGALVLLYAVTPLNSFRLSL